jgi:GNAT superfamily N-acetyltransferase
MIHELHNPGESDLAFESPFPEASAVLVGNNPGRAFVDDVKRPRSALVWAQGMQGFYLTGDADNAPFLEQVDTLVDEVLQPRLRDLGIAWFEVSGDDDWNPVIERVFAKRNLGSSQQWVYVARPTNHGSTAAMALPGDCRLATAEQCLAGDRRVTNESLLRSKISQFWGSADAFLGTGIGHALVCEGEIASLCFSAFAVGNVHVIDIETEVSHQRKGYAQTVARAFIAKCSERRLTLHWDCMAENTASVRLAEKLGLARSRAYTLYSFLL